MFASSGGVVYGDPEVIPTPETAPKMPVSPYGVSKLSGEYYLRALGALRGFKAGCLLTVSDVVVEGEFVRISDEEMKAAVDHLPGVSRWVQVPSQVFDYLSHPTCYRSPETTAALEGSGIVVPRFPAYVDRLVEFVRRHPQLVSAGEVGRRRRRLSMPRAEAK